MGNNKKNMFSVFLKKTIKECPGCSSYDIVVLILICKTLIVDIKSELMNVISVLNSKAGVPLKM